MRLAQKVLLHVYQHWHVQLLQHISYLTPNITYAASPGLNLSATGTGWVNGKLTFSSNCSLPLRWCQGILLLHSFAVPGSWDLCGLFVDYRWCGGWEVVLCIFWHRWESKVAFTALKGRLLHPHFCLCWRREGTFQGDSPLSCSCRWERFQQDRGTRQNWRGCIYSCLHACSISFTPPRILPCGFFFSLEGKRKPLRVFLVLRWNWLFHRSCLTLLLSQPDFLHQINIPCKHHGMEGCEPSPVWVIVHWYYLILTVLR